MAKEIVELIRLFDMKDYDYQEETYDGIVKIIQMATIFETAVRGFIENGMLEHLFDVEEEKAKKLIICIVDLAGNRAK